MFLDRPIIITTTRRVDLAGSDTLFIEILVDGLSDEHTATILQVWCSLSSGEDIDRDSALDLARLINGHPLAAQLCAPLIASYVVDYITNYPRELITLRRDLARRILNDIELGDDSEIVMESLALVGVPVPASVIASAVGWDSDRLHLAIKECVDSGLIRGTRGLAIHPLVEDHFWNRHLHRSNYKELAAAVGAALVDELERHEIGSIAFAQLLPPTFRALAIAGDLEGALDLRSDLLGALTDAAVTLYRRRDYVLARRYCDYVLEEDPQNWTARLHRARIAIREEEWNESEALLAAMLVERPRDISVRHAQGWRLMRMRQPDQALSIFLEIIAERSHVQSMRDAADCLHRLGRDEEALSILSQAKEVESPNAYVLELEARILQEKEDWAGAVVAAAGAVNRDPGNWSLRHRLGLIRAQLGDEARALEDLREATRLAPTEFTPFASLADAALNAGESSEVEDAIERAADNARDGRQRGVVVNLRARLLRAMGDLVEAERILEAVHNNANEPHNSGVLLQIEIDLARRDLAANLPALARVRVRKAHRALGRVRQFSPSYPGIPEWERAIHDIEERL